MLRSQTPSPGRRQVGTRHDSVELGVAIGPGDVEHAGDDQPAQHRRHRHGQRGDGERQPSPPSRQTITAATPKNGSRSYAVNNTPIARRSTRPKAQARALVEPGEQDEQHARRGHDDRVRVRQRRPVGDAGIGGEHPAGRDGRTVAVTFAHEQRDRDQRANVRQQRHNEAADLVSERLHRRVGDRGEQQPAQHEAPLPHFARLPVEHLEHRQMLRMVEVVEVAARLRDDGKRPRRRVRRHRSRRQPDREQQQGRCPDQMGAESHGAVAACAIKISQSAGDRQDGSAARAQR